MPTGLGHAISYVAQTDIPPGARDERRMVAAYDPETKVVVVVLQGDGTEDAYRLAIPSLSPPAAYAKQNALVQ